MSELQIIRTPMGEELVVLSRVDYEALLARAAVADEDAEDLAVYDARKAELAIAHHGALPPEVSAAMLAGDSLLHAIRKWRGKTQSAVAELAGIQQGYLSDLESGRRHGAPETLERLARALDVPFNWIAR